MKQEKEINKLINKLIKEIIEKELEIWIKGYPKQKELLISFANKLKFELTY